MFKKYATATIISAEIAERNAVGLVKASHRAVFNYEPREGYLYVRSRMISSRCNDNWDEFPAEEIKAAWKTAKGKPAFVNHVNEDHRRMRGVIIDAALHEDVLPDGKPDVWIEALHEIDAKRFPKLAEAILSGKVCRTSMGCDVGFSVCSACGNKASTPAEYCQHIPRMKGKILYRHTASGQREGHLIREICHKLSFFENSFLVEDPADPTAVVTGVDDRGLKSMASRKTALPKIADYHVWCEREGCGDAHWGPDGAAGLLIRHKGEDGQHRYLLQKRSPWVDHGSTWGIPGGALHEGESPEEGAHREGREEMGDIPELAHHRTHTDDHGGWAYHTVIMDADEQFHPGEWDEESTGHAWFTKPEMKNLDLHPGFAQSLHAVTEGDGMQTQSSLPSIEVEAVVYKHPTDHPFFKEDVSIHPRHIIAAYDEADGPTRAQGMRWYSDGHHVAKALDPDGDAHRGAGVLAAYSPRSNWPINLFNASRSLQQRKAVRIGEGMNVMGNHAKSAAKILEDGKHYLQAFTTPKITDFAHLLAHGGDDEECAHCEPHKKPDHPKRAVVVDRHALSAAAGRRMTDNDLGRAPLGTRKFYEHVADQYRDAADTISHRDGTLIHPHQLQAITWLQQQKRNAAQEQGEAATDPKAKGRITRERNAWQAWEEHSQKHHPEFQSGDEANMHLRNPHKHSSLPTVAFRKGAPFAGYDDFEDCTEKNSDKDDASAYCGEIKKRTEGSHDGVQGVREGVRAGAGTSGAEANSLPRVQTAQQAREAHAGGSQAARRAGERADQGRSVAARGVRPQGVLAAEAPGDREAGRSVRGMRDDELAGAVDQSRGRANGHGGHQAVARAVQGSAGGGAGVRSALPELSAPLGVQQGSDQAAGLGRVQASARAGVSGEIKHRSEGSRSSLPSIEAYNETKAPQDVDTLRAESCPVCGETDSFDGDRCQVCNFIQPPAMFTDPDTGVAKQMDLRKDDLDTTQVGPDGQPIEGIPDPSEMSAEEGMPGEPGDSVADLFCPACGFSADTQEPMTNNDPSAPSEQQGLLEGDVCPNCGQATMLSPNDVEMMGGEVPQEIADDMDADAVPDDEEADANADGIPDDADLDEDGVPDLAEQDADADGVPDDEEGPEAPAGDGDEDQDAEPEGDDSADRDPVEDDEEPQKGRKDNSRRAARRGHEREQMNQPNKAAAEMSVIAALKSQVEAQDRTIKAQGEILKIAGQQLHYLATLAGVAPEFEAIKTEGMKKVADILNPAQPIPDPPAEGPTETTQEAEAPKTFDDPRSPGITPGSTDGVPAQMTDSPLTPGATMDTSPYTQLVDVTKPVAGTETHVPLDQTKIETDVRVGDPMVNANNPQGYAFPLNPEFAADGASYANTTTSPGMQQKAASRTMASIRLAKLRKNAGLIQGDTDELVVAAEIERTASLTDEMIEHEITTLDSLAKTAARSPARRPQGGPMPKVASAQRHAPSLAADGRVPGMQVEAASGFDASDASDIFLTEVLTD